MIEKKEYICPNCKQLYSLEEFEVCNNKDLKPEAKGCSLCKERKYEYRERYPYGETWDMILRPDIFLILLGFVIAGILGWW